MRRVKNHNLIYSDNRKEEVLLGVEFNDDSMLVRVEAHKDTEEDFFEVDVVETKLHDLKVFRIMVYRVVEDESSEKVTGGLTLNFLYKELLTHDRICPEKGDCIVIENLFKAG